MMIFLASIICSLSVITPSHQEFTPPKGNFSLAGLAVTTNKQLAADVCGQPNGDKVASDTRSPQTWTKYAVDNWVKTTVGPIQRSGFKDDAGSFPDLQTLILHLAGNEGSETCDEISSPVCTGTGLDFNLCNQYPEAHFVFFAITHYANFLHKLHATFTFSSLAAGLDTATVVKQFFTPQASPNQLILPVAIMSGLFTAMSIPLGPLAIGSAAATITSGALTEAGLNAVDPLVQWGEVQSAISKLYTSVTVALDEYFNDTLHSWGKSKDYLNDKIALPALLAEGAFASNVQVGAINKDVFGAVIAPAINSLWIEDQVFIIKISDTALGNGPKDFACKGNTLFGGKEYVVCREGIAYVFARWVIKDIARSRIDHLDSEQWFVWGLSSEGSGGDGSKDANRLADYGLNLPAILESAIKNQAKHGYLYKYDQQDTIDQLNNDPRHLTQADLASWTIPICDIDAVLKAHGKTFIGADYKGGPSGLSVQTWAVCTCLQVDKWPRDQYGPHQFQDNPDCFPGWG